MIVIFIKKTWDGGQTWEYCTVPEYRLDGESEFVFRPADYHYINDSVGWMCGNSLGGVGSIIQTKDAGMTWNLIFERDTDFHKIHYLNEQKAIGSGRGSSICIVNISNNNFEGISHEFYHNFIQDVFYFNDTIIWMTDHNGKIFKSINGGNSFEEQALDATYTGHYFNKIDFFGNTGYVFSTYGALLKLVDSTLVSNKQQLQTNSLNLYPNPAKDYCNIQNSSNVSLQVSIFNLNGKLIETIPIEGNEMTPINVFHWPMGIYIMHAKNNNFNHTTRFMVK